MAKLVKMTDDYAILRTTCPFCGKVNMITVDRTAYMAWRMGDINIQNAFPHMNPNTREQLQTGICPTCWNSMFKEEDDAEDDDYTACMAESLSFTGQWW